MSALRTEKYLVWLWAPSNLRVRSLPFATLHPEGMSPRILDSSEPLGGRFPGEL